MKEVSSVAAAEIYVRSAQSREVLRRIGPF